MKLVKHAGLHFLNPIIIQMVIPMLGSYCKYVCRALHFPPFPWEGNMDRCCF